MDESEHKLSLLIIIISSFLLIYLLHTLLNKLWLSPIRFQRLMMSQGIRGPPYKFLYGNTKAMKDMKIKNMSKPMDISHDIYPRISPFGYECGKVYGGNHLTWLGTQPQLTVTDLEMIKEIMNDRDGAFPKPPIMSFLRELFGDGLVTTIEMKKWTKVRKIANHAFHGENLKSMVPTMVDSADMMLQKWRNYVGKEVEVHEEFRLLTSDVISKTAFGSSYLEGKMIFELLVKLVTILTKSPFAIKIPLISKLVRYEDEKQILQLQKEIRNLVIKMIKKREDNVKKGDTDSAYGSDFLGILVRSYNNPDHNQKMLLDEVIDECRTIYIAGQESTNNLLSWIVFLLAIHQDWQEEARKEVFSIFGHDVPINDGIPKLKIMSMILNETLRLYPAIPGQMRNTAKELKLGRLQLPANTNLYIPMLAMHHDSKIWGKDVHEFKPERFEEGIAKATNNNMAAFTPFGLGPRMCAGNNFAINEAKIALCMILQKYRFRLSCSYVHSPIMVLTIKPQYGVKVVLQTVSDAPADVRVNNGCLGPQ